MSTVHCAVKSIKPSLSLVWPPRHTDKNALGNMESIQHLLNGNWKGGWVVGCRWVCGWDQPRFYTTQVFACGLWISQCETSHKQRLGCLPPTNWMRTRRLGGLWVVGEGSRERCGGLHNPGLVLWVVKPLTSRYGLIVGWMRIGRLGGLWGGWEEEREMWRFTQPRALLLLSPPAPLSLSSYLRLTSLPPLSAPGVGISWFKMHMISGLKMK